jgi:hypothetical protein
MPHRPPFENSTRRAAAGLCVVIAAIAAVSGACLPVLSGSPRVDRGWAANMSVVLPVARSPSKPSTSTSNYSSGIDLLPIPVTANLSYGWSPDLDHRPSFRLGATFPEFLPMLPMPEAYLQAPRSMTMGLDAGVGVSLPWLATSNPMPYVALGHLNSTGSGWFTLAGYLTNFSAGLEGNIRPNRVLANSLGYQFEATHFFVQSLFDVGSGEPWMVTGGFTHEFHRGPRQPR